jgi:hypothetical protein
MDKQIGIDARAASGTIAVVDARGKQASSHVVATNGLEMVECVEHRPFKRHFASGDQRLPQLGTKDRVPFVNVMQSRGISLGGLEQDRAEILRILLQSSPS